MNDLSAHIKKIFSAIWPRRLLGQTIVLLILALFSAQIISALIVRSETQSFYRGAEDRFLSERLAPFISLMRDSPAHRRPDLARAISNRRVAYWFAETPVVGRMPHHGAHRKHDEDDDDRDEYGRADALARRMATELGPYVADAVRVHINRRHGEEGEDDDDHHRPGGAVIPGALIGAPGNAETARFLIAADLGDGTWLNAAVQTRRPRTLIRPEGWIAFFVAAAAITLVVAIALGRITRPLGRLAQAAEKLGRGERTPTLREEGPEDIRDAIRAFNEMQERIDRFVNDRTRMLAAISHDLRTPITSLRLRAEMLDDAETRAKMIATLDEMQKMAEAGLSFARAETDGEQTRPTDISALGQSICDDLGDMGKDVTFMAAGAVVYPCRPLALTRAVRNLIENALRYGLRARVALRGSATAGIDITVDDDGPGIDGSAHERVFEPFVRLDDSRSAETGGIGLGLAITRDIIRRHGGEVALENRPEGGLRATISLPPIS